MCAWREARGPAGPGRHRARRRERRTGWGTGLEARESLRPPHPRPLASKQLLVEGAGRSWAREPRGAPPGASAAQHSPSPPPSRAALLSAPPSLPLLPSSREGGGGGGWAGGFAALWSPASEALAKQPRGRAAGSARARAPPPPPSAASPRPNKF